MDWVEAIGYQHEVLHTAALAHLLRSDNGPGVAGALIGDCEIDRVDDVWSEQRLTGRRPIDLAAWLVTPAGSRTLFGVETKVDSAWSPAQLTETVPVDAYGVLLAVGYTALAATDGDLAELSPTPGQWRLVRPRRWAQIVREHAAGDRELNRYADRILQEADEQDSALQAVAAARPVMASEDRDAQTLSHWAYFHAVLDRRPDVAEWERKTLISGPLLTLWVRDLDRTRGDYLEFMGHSDGRRSLNAKTYAPPGTGQLNASRTRLRKLLADFDPADVKRPGAAANTCTAARWWLDDKTPRQASALVDDLCELLDPERSA